MCESSVWVRYPDGRLEKIGDEVMFLRQEGPFIVWRSLFGEAKRLTGRIQEVDLMKHTITMIAEEELDSTEADRAMTPGSSVDDLIGNTGSQESSHHRHPH